MRCVSTSGSPFKGKSASDVIWNNGNLTSDSTTISFSALLIKNEPGGRRSDRIANANLASYLVPVNADLPHIDVTFLNYPDTKFAPDRHARHRRTRHHRRRGRGRQRGPQRRRQTRAQFAHHPGHVAVRIGAVDKDWEETADRLANAAVSDGDPTRWFDELYSSGARGEHGMPWDRGQPNGLIAEWGDRHDGAGARALVIGSGLGRDSEYLATRGYAVTAIDVSPTAISTAQQRYPDSTVHYRVANLLDAPADLRVAFDLVVESYTVQALPPTVRADATKAVTDFVAPGGTLLVIATLLPDGEPLSGPPWKMSRANIDAFAAHGLDPVLVEDVDGDSGWRHWRAEFHRRAD